MKKKKHKKIEKRRQAKTAKKRSKKKRKKPSNSTIDISPPLDNQFEKPILNHRKVIDQVKLFDAKKFRIVFNSIPPSYEEEGFVENLRRLDNKIIFRDDSFNYSHYLSFLSSDLYDFFSLWCLEKGMDETSAEMCSSMVYDYFFFIYQRHGATFYLANSSILDQFYFEYYKIEYPKDLSLYSFSGKALELLYRFLKEKCYLKDVATIAYLIQGKQFKIDKRIKKIVEVNKLKF